MDYYTRRATAHEDTVKLYNQGLKQGLEREEILNRINRFVARSYGFGPKFVTKVLEIEGLT